MWSETGVRTAASCGSRHQARDAKQVVGGASEIGVHLHSSASAEAGFAQPTDRLHPAEGLLDPFADPLTDRVARVTRGARVERRASGPPEILRHMGGNLEFPTRCDEIAGVITFVPAQGDSAAPSQAFISHRDRRTALGSAVRRLDLNIDEQAVAVLSQGIGRIAKLGLFALALAGQQCLGVSGRLMRLIRATLTMEVYCRVARITGSIAGLLILALEALKRSPCLDQSPVHGEVLGGEQFERTRLLHHSPEELSRHLVFQKPVAVGGKAGMVETRLVHLHIQKPAEQQVIFKLFAEQPFATHRVERHQQRRFEHPFGIEGLPIALYIRSKLGDSSLSTACANCLIRLSGCSLGTRCSRSITINIDRCRRPSPRIPPIPPTSSQTRPPAKTIYIPICFM